MAAAKVVETAAKAAEGGKVAEEVAEEVEP